jgi:hypothetical protein
LTNPKGCLPGYEGPALLDAALAANVANGYIFEVVATPGTGGKGAERYAVLANPERPPSTGVRSFCADASGLFCQSRERLLSTGGSCPPTCMPMTSQD